MKLRKLHRKVAIFLSPFFLLSAVTGAFLLFRKAGVYGKEVKHFLVSIHTWEIVMPYIGFIMVFGLLFVTISGVILYFNPRA